MVDESPAVARRRLRLALRKAREAKGLTQGLVAEKLEWSISKVNRIESGEVTVSGTDLRALLALYDVTDSTVVQALAASAKVSRRRGWWDEARIREHLTPATIQLLQFETEATAIRVFHPTLVPGLLQTRQYAEFIMNFWVNDLSEAARSARLDVRMRRRAHVFGRSDPPQYLLILDESVLSRKVGGAEVMAAQLYELLALHRNPTITVRVVPLADAATLAMLGQFILLDLGDEENAVLYRESRLADEIVHSPEVTHRYRQVFEQMWELSLSNEASAKLIDAHAAAMLESVRRDRL